MGERNRGFRRLETRFSGARYKRKRLAASLACVASGTLLYVGARSMRYVAVVAAVADVAAGMDHLYWVFRHSCLI